MEIKFECIKIQNKQVFTKRLKRGIVFKGTNMAPDILFWFSQYRFEPSYRVPHQLLLFQHHDSLLTDAPLQIAHSGYQYHRRLAHSLILQILAGIQKDK